MYSIIKRLKKNLIICCIIILILIITNLITFFTMCHKIKALEMLLNTQPIPQFVAEIVNDLPVPVAEPETIEDKPVIEPEEEIIEEPEPEVAETASYAPTSLAVMMAKVVWGEARGLGQTEQSCVVWTILNRAEAWGKSVESIITAPNQFYYDPSFPTIDDHGRDITVLTQQILTAWENGDDSIRTLPRGYFFYVGDGSHNYFYADYNNHVYWDYSLGTPYSD